MKSIALTDHTRISREKCTLVLHDMHHIICPCWSVARSQPGHSLSHFNVDSIDLTPKVSPPPSALLSHHYLSAHLFFLLFSLSLIYTHTNGERQVGRYAGKLTWTLTQCLRYSRFLGSATRWKYLYVCYMSPFSLTL